MIHINIGIDIGGSHIGMGWINDDGEIKARKYIYYERDNFDIESSFEVINEFINKYEENADTVGIGVPGFATESMINYTCNLPLKDLEVTDYIKTRLPIFVSNDSNCATIAEYEIIDRKMFSNYILVTIGTGIGSGIILNGNLYTGSTGCAGEIGHMVIDKDGIECSCGRKGCFEKYASISALLKMTGTDNLKEAFYLIDKNPNIQNVFDNYIENLSEGLSNVINMFDPEILVIGGSLSEYEEEYMYKLKSKMVSKIYNKYTYDLDIKTARLKNDAGIIGAGLLHKYIN